jgi:hypothetical protein
VDEDEERPAAAVSIADPVAVQGDLAVLHRVSEHLSAILPEHGTIKGLNPAEACSVLKEALESAPAVENRG